MRVLRVTAAVVAGWLCLAVTLAVADSSGRDQRANAVIGYWASPESVLHVARTDNGLSMQVVALLEPYYAPGEEFGPVGAERRDDRNPDPAKRQVPIIGLELLSDYAYADDRWRGRIYDPESGKIYASTIRVAADGRLKMRGYIGMPMFGRTQSFVPVHACTEVIVTMLALGNLAPEPGCEQPH